MMVARSWAWVGVGVESWELEFDGCRISVWEIEKGSKEGGDACTTV